MARNVTRKFGVTGGLDFTAEQGITQIPLNKLVPYSHHRFTLYNGERLEDMIQSIKKNGVITPIIVRTMNDGKYEILSGHNRVYAAGQAGLEAVPAVVKANLSDEAAEIFVVETNLIQRGFSDLKISEQAFAVALRYNKLFDERKLKAIEDELYYIENGKRRQEDVPVEHHTTREATAEEYGISQSMAARLLRIDKLTDKLKEYVDNGSIKIRPAVELSYLSEKQQNMLTELMEEMQIDVINTVMARQLRDIASSYREVTDEMFAEVLTGEYQTDNSRDRGEKITLPSATYSRYFGKYSKSEANRIIEKALELYFKQN